MFDITDIIGPLPPVRIVDVGAMTLGPATESYAALLAAGIATVVGFEPVEDECRKLRETAGPNHTYLPYAIGDGRRRTLHVCNYPMTSSLYEPNTELLLPFQNLEELMRVVSRVEVDTHRLDDIEPARGADYVKLDVQGAELDVINGAAAVLDDAVLVHTEVEFVEMYKGQPLFAEVDQALRARGFVFHKFSSLYSRVFKPVVVNGNVNHGLSQYLWADAVYMKDFMRLGALPPEKVLRLAVILHLVYRSFDAVRWVLSAYDEQAGTDFGDRYVQRLCAPQPQPSQAQAPST